MSPDTRRHRGAHPEDRRLFAPEALPALRAAVTELSWLLSRGYPPAASLKLAGDRHRLSERQRVAVSRAACADQNLERRLAARVEPAAAARARLLVDGFNLIITVEAALSGGPVLLCRDGCTRDLSSVHGSYRAVTETEPAIRLIGATLARLRPRSVHWLLDQPVSNSGRLAARIREIAGEHGWSWSVETVFNPDTVLRSGVSGEETGPEGEPDPRARVEGVVVSSDSIVLDGAPRWLDLSTRVIEEHVPDAWRVDLRE